MINILDKIIIIDYSFFIKRQRVYFTFLQNMYEIL
jgi:hypothetical protein